MESKLNLANKLGHHKRKTTIITNNSNHRKPNGHHTHTHSCTHTCMHARTHALTHTHTHTHTQAHTYSHIHTHTHTTAVNWNNLRQNTSTITTVNVKCKTAMSKLPLPDRIPLHWVMEGPETLTGYRGCSLPFRRWPCFFFVVLPISSARMRLTWYVASAVISFSSCAGSCPCD